MARLEARWSLWEEAPADVLDTGVEGAEAAPRRAGLIHDPGLPGLSSQTASVD
jgi:hypothetical protein